MIIKKSSSNLVWWLVIELVYSNDVACQLSSEIRKFWYFYLSVPILCPWDVKVAVALCDADKDLLYPIVALFSKLLKRVSNKLKIPMAHFTSVGFCKRKIYNAPLTAYHTTESPSFNINTLLVYKYCKDINIVNCCSYCVHKPLRT